MLIKYLAQLDAPPFGQRQVLGRMERPGDRTTQKIGRPCGWIRSGRPAWVAGVVGLRADLGPADLGGISFLSI